MENNWEEAAKEHYETVWFKSDTSTFPIPMFIAGAKHAEKIVWNQAIDDVKGLIWKKRYETLSAAELVEEIEKLKK